MVKLLRLNTTSGHACWQRFEVYMQTASGQDGPKDLDPVMILAETSPWPLLLKKARTRMEIPNCALFIPSN